MSSPDTLNRIQSYASITASVAVPLLIAIFGWVIQSKTSDDTVKKDYVQMALNILNADKEKVDDTMRQWAISVLDINSPVPFSKDMKASLEKGQSISIKTSFQLPPSIFMDPPKPLKKLAEDDNGSITVRDLAKNAVENYSICSENSIRFTGLQDLLIEHDKIYNPTTSDAKK